MANCSGEARRASNGFGRCAVCGSRYILRRLPGQMHRIRGLRLSVVIEQRTKAERIRRIIWFNLDRKIDGYVSSEVDPRRPLFDYFRCRRRKCAGYRNIALRQFQVLFERVGRFGLCVRSGGWICACAKVELAVLREFQRAQVRSFILGRKLRPVFEPRACTQVRKRDPG